MTQLRLNPALDVEAIRSELVSNRRVQIRDVLVPEDAERIHGILEQETPWWTAFNDGVRVAQVSPEMQMRLTQEQIVEIQQGIQQRAKRQYQFLYQYYPLLGHYFEAGTPWVPLMEVFEFMNSAPMLDFLRRITGRDDIRWADGQGTLYRAGHFLKCHSDEQQHEQRIAAYVLNMTKDWERDWGGYLEFYDSEDDVEQAFKPRFNALNIFLIPMLHSVGMVSSFAPGSRYSVTGWMRGDDPPGPFDRRGT